MKNREDFERPRGRTPIVWVDRYTGELLEVMHSLPLSSRAPEEVLEDRAIEFAFAASQSRSERRRRHSLVHSEFVVAYLDELDERARAIGERAVTVFMAYARGRYPEPESPSAIK